VFENGYFRPDWITFEKSGVNGRSPFPRDPAAIIDLAEKAGDRVEPSRSLRRSQRLVLGDVAFHVAAWLGTPLFPRYRRFRRPHPLTEAAGWVLKAAQMPGRASRSRRRWQSVRASHRKMFFYPLQLDHDFQLLVDSDFQSLSEATAVVVASFAHHAPGDAVLVVKNHPRDNNLVNREREVQELAARFGVAERVVFLETGSNPDIFQRCAGMVTINSTMGTSALLHDVPVCVLGRAVYDIEGLTHRGHLDSFWTAPTAPDPAFFQAFRRAITHSAQIKGEFGATARTEKHFEDCLLKVHLTPFRPAGLNLARNISRPQAAPQLPADVSGAALRGSQG
jgi:capsular polysaccharide export protein